MGNRIKEFVELKDAEPKTFYTENINLYQNKILNSAIMIIYRGFIYLIQIEERT